MILPFDVLVSAYRAGSVRAIWRVSTGSFQSERAVSLPADRAPCRFRRMWARDKSFCENSSALVLAATQRQRQPSV